MWFQDVDCGVQHKQELTSPITRSLVMVDMFQGTSTFARRTSYPIGKPAHCECAVYSAEYSSSGALSFPATNGMI